MASRRRESYAERRERRAAVDDPGVVLEAAARRRVGIGAHWRDDEPVGAFADPGGGSRALAYGATY